jgi:hypothetical protein
MKKLILALAFMALIVGAYAQDAINEVRVNNFYKFTGTDAFGDTLTNTGTITRYFNVNRDDAYYYVLQTVMDETSGTSGCHVLWSGSLDGANGWTAIGSADTLTADGAATETSLSTAIAWRYLRCVVTGYGTTTWDLDYILIKLVGKKD